MRGCLVSLVVIIGALILLCFCFFFPLGFIGSGLEDFEGRERRMAGDVLIHVESFYGSGILEIGDYNGPLLVLGWHIENVERCSGAPSRKDLDTGHYNAIVRARGEIGAYTLFGIPLGEMEVTCRGDRRWKPRF